jgi:Tfp pilus assembly protein PilV
MTLVEVLVAMVILVVGVLGVAPLLDTANKVTDENLARDTANALVREQLERAREMPALTLTDVTAVARDWCRSAASCASPRPSPGAARSRAGSPSCP